jgi:hypothetical protein
LRKRSYNAGMGNLLKAQRLVQGAIEYDRIASALVTGYGAVERAPDDRLRRANCPHLRTAHCGVG